MTDYGVQPIVEASAGLESVITELYEKSGNSGLSREQFGVILKRSPPGICRRMPLPGKPRNSMPACGWKSWHWPGFVPRARNERGKSSWRVTARSFMTLRLISPRKAPPPANSRLALCRPLRNHHPRRPAGFETGFIHRARFSGGLAAHRDGAGVREPLSPPAPTGQPG